MATAQISAEQRLVLDAVDWRSYTRCLRLFRDRPATRITYDRGTLEIMTLSHEHESRVSILRRLVEALTEELNLPVKAGRSTTFRRRKQKRGLEADESWWIANEARVRGKTKIDLRVDPPPDLALEIDVTSSSLDRLSIYAVLRVPEVWRYSEDGLVFHVLGPDGKYTVAAASRAFPGVTPADIARFLPLVAQMDENAVLRQFRAWVRQQFPTGGSNL